MDVLNVTKALRARWWLGYAVALCAPVAALVIRLALGAALVGYPFLTFFPAVLVTAFLGGMVPGILATLLSAILANYYLIEPMGWPLPVEKSDWIGLLFFLAICGTVVVLIGWLYQVIAQRDDALAAMDGLNADLENRVAMRTRELADTNERLRGEIEAREAAEAQARQAQRMDAIGQLTGGIAHDFNNMLAVVIGSIEIGRKRLAAGQTDIVRFLDNAMDGARRGAALTQRLLAFSRQSPLDPVVTDVNGLVRGMEDLLRRSIGEHISIEFVLSGGIWLTRVDPGQLENALVNLVVNARDAMPEGGHLTVETLNGHLDDAYAAAHAEVTPGQYIVIAISDTGSGMPPEIAAKAFEPFFTTKPVGQGTGLGLSQVFGFVKQSGGHVKIYTEPGRGTTMKIYLRRDRSTDQPGVREVQRLPEPMLPMGSVEEIILVVEDEAEVRRTSVTALRELGYTVRHAQAGIEALALIEEIPGVALLFTDVVMPGMTGRALADAARLKSPSLKVLYTTGYTPNAIVHNGMLDPGVDLLTKPFTLDQLARKVRKVLDEATQTAL